MRIEERFMRHVQPEPNSGCWLWLGALINVGYGKFQTTKLQSSHRVSYELFVGPIPTGLQVLHKCDNPVCVNPGHLFLGTHSENMADRQRKKRGFFPKGEKHGRVKLNNGDVLTIRSSGETQETLARHYGVSQSLISQIKRKILWDHLV